MRWLEEIRGLGAGEVEVGACLRPMTTLRVGGEVEALLKLDRPSALPAVLEVCRRNGVPYRFLGNGSNVLPLDGGVDGVVVLMKGLRACRMAGPETVEAEAGCALIALVQFAHAAGLVGMEWSSGIPGSVGGAMVMNAGAHGGEIKDSLTEALIVEAGREPRWVAASELGYAYRTSRLQSHDVAVLAGRFRLGRGDVAEGRQLVRRYLQHRRDTQPTGNNAGSMFRNPPGDFAGRLIEAVGGKGRRHGGAEISRLHANFFLNTGEATAADVLALADWAQGRVRETFGLDMRLEVEVWGRP